MGQDINTLASLIRGRMKQKGLNQPQLSKITGVTQPVISRLIGKSKKEKINQQNVGVENIYTILRELNLLNTEPDTSPIELPMVVTVNSRDEKELLNGAADDYRGIPLYESGRLAAGVNGVEFDPYEAPVSVVVVYKPELQGRSRHKLAAIKVGGESMEPTITKGSIVVVDLSDKELAEGKVFVVNSPDGGMDMASIKRVHKWENGFLLLSDNPNYPPNPSKLDWNRLCVGRVVWMWRDIRNI